MEGKEIERLADQFMRSGKTIGGGDSGWIRAAFIEGYKANIETATLQSELEKAKELLKIIKDVERGLLFMQLPAEVREKLTTFLSDGKK